MYGASSKEDILGRSALEFISQAEQEKAATDILGIIAGEARKTTEYNIVRGDGSRYDTEVSPSVLKDTSGNPIGIIAIIRDITERRQAENQLRQSEEKLRLMFESVTEGVTITDLTGNIIDTNEATARIHSFGSRQKLIGQSAFKLIAERDYAKATENLEKTLTEGCSGTLEYTLLREDRSEFHGELVASLMKDATGNPVGFVAITRDITSRKRAEQEITEKNQALEEANAQLQEVDRLKSIFLSSISHELRTPLNSIIGFTSLILDGMTGDINEEQREQLTLVKSSSNPC